MNPRTVKTIAPTVREIKRDASAREALEALAPGGSIITLTFGQFSIGDAVRALLDRTGPAEVTISTWTAAKAEIEHAYRMIEDGRIQSMRWLVDRSFATRQPEYCRALLDRFGEDSIRTTRTHAKWATIVGGGFHFAVRTSCNLNTNPRLELIEVSDSEPLAGWFNGIADELWDTLDGGDLAGELPARVRTDDAAGPVKMGQVIRLG